MQDQWSVQGANVTLVAQTYTSIQGLTSAALAANATYSFDVFVAIQLVGIQGCQYGFQCTQSGAHQGGSISALMRGTQALGGSATAGIGVTDFRVAWGSQAGVANANQVGNQGVMMICGTFTTNAVAGSQFSIQCKGNQATVTPTIYSTSWARYTRIA